MGLRDADTWIIAGTSSATIASYSGYQYGSVSGRDVQNPPDGSGLSRQPTKPSSPTHRRSSSTESAIPPLGVCGSWHAAAKCVGNRPATRCTRSLLARAQARATAGSSTSWAIAEARGEKIIRSPPRSRRIRSWLRSMLSTIASSPIAGAAGGADPSWSAASCAARNSCSGDGAVV